MDAHRHFEIAQHLWDAIATADADALRELLSDKCVWRMYGRSPMAGAHVGPEAVFAFLAQVGERADDLKADLLDVFVSERGGVIHYAVSARRGPHQLDIEHLVLMRIEREEIVELVFAPIDQERYDRFWLADVEGEEASDFEDVRQR